MEEHNIIQKKLMNIFNGHTPRCIPLQRRGQTFEARVCDDRSGFIVSNLGAPIDRRTNSNYLPLEVFYVAVGLLLEKGGEAIKGNVYNNRLGDDGLPLDSVEGIIAHKVYGKNIGDIVFRRISPVNGILLASEICQGTRGGYMMLSGAFRNSPKSHSDQNNQ
ncbi:hypothetical protein HAP94_01905 [Acidithiobacillus ferrivorans]|nr:hypothetical protein [Acidithiobacillus ferrivorans]